MGENVILLFEINDQIKEKHGLKQKIKANKMKIDELSHGQTNMDDGMLFEGDIHMELRAQDLKIDELTRQIEEYQQSNQLMRQ